MEWIDTHCHLDAAEFDADRQQVIGDALAGGVGLIVIPAIAACNFGTVARLAAQWAGGRYALGIHPLCTPGADEADIGLLRAAVEAALDDPRFIGIGEIGLDYFIDALKTEAGRARQEWFYVEQLKVARDFGLPVLLHVRRSQDRVLKYLRRIAVPGGIAHAFNGSVQQARAYVDLGFKLGFGGAMTWQRALRIRELAATMPAASLVLETDAPDIPPEWLSGTVAGKGADEGAGKRNAPGQLPRIGAALAALRGWSVEETARVTTANARHALPRL